MHIDHNLRYVHDRSESRPTQPGFRAELRVSRLGFVNEDATAEQLDQEPVTPQGPGDEIEPQLSPEARERRRAALAQVRIFGDPVLKSPATPVADFDAGLAEEIERMIAIMRDGLGVGLAATQLGLMRRLLVFQAGFDATPTAVANPEIEWSSGDLVVAEEGCLSLPHVVVEVERPLHVRVRGQGARGEPILLEASGLEARVLQHEIDHLDGVLILDRTERDQRKGALRALREGGSFTPERPEPEHEPAAAEA
jgi:peptide deformylase